MTKSKYGVSVKEASRRLGIPEASVRILMKRGKLPIGMAVQLTGEKYTFYISEEMLDSYIGSSGAKEDKQYETTCT